MKIAFVFPGQGSQMVGMGRELAENFAEARAVFAEADAALGTDLSGLCWNGPEEELQKTANTQPAIVTTSTACLRVLEREGVKADCVAGHSVGEYSALVAAGSLGLSDAVRLTRLRGQLMETACPQGTGTMAAIIGMDEARARELCLEVASIGAADIAGLNCPGQVVIAGHVAALTELVARAKAAGAGSATLLKVSGPFHSRLMAPAQEGLRSSLEKTSVASARLPVIANVDAAPHSEPSRLRANLLGQLTMPVLWQKSVERMIADGISLFCELGAGRVLSGLLRRTSREIQILNVGDLASLEKALAVFKASPRAS